MEDLASLEVSEEAGLLSPQSEDFGQEEPHDRPKGDEPKLQNGCARRFRGVEYVPPTQTKRQRNDLPEEPEHNKKTEKGTDDMGEDVHGVCWLTEKRLFSEIPHETIGLIVDMSILHPCI